MSRRDERRRELEVIREDAAQTARAGLPITKCPHRGDMNEIQWKEAYVSEVQEMQREEERAEADAEYAKFRTLETQIKAIASMDELKRCLLALLELVEEQTHE